MTCRFATKGEFATRELAQQGAKNIRTTVEARGGVFQTLYPYLCPDAHHWHLSHRRQGHKACPDCREIVPAWDAGWYWVIAPHGNCSGQGKSVAPAANVPIVRRIDP